jgi:hypothetical protein
LQGRVWLSIILAGIKQGTNLYKLAAQQVIRREQLVR